MLRQSFAAGLLLAVTSAAAAQSRSAALVQTARGYIGSGDLDRADTALADALAAAGYVLDSVNVFVWRGILEYKRGHEDLARQSFRRALATRQVRAISDLDQVAPGLGDVFDSEARAYRVYRNSELEQPAAWRAGPALLYPSELRRRRVAGHALIRAVVDTAGKVEEQGLEVLESPDSAFDAPLRRMMLATQFTPGRSKGHVVRSQIDLGFNLSPPAPANPTTLVTAAREQLRLHRADSALALTTEALDSANQATAGERVFALLVQGAAWHVKGKDSLATISLDEGIAGYRDLTSRGVDLAPFLKRLADSIRIARRGTRAAPPPFGAVTVVGAADEAPVLISHPPIRYAPEMQRLGVSGTVIVEATLDTTGRVVPASVKVIQSPNPVFDAETRRVVLASVYRPARVQGKASRVTIRQPITFAPY